MTFPEMREKTLMESLHHARIRSIQNLLVWEKWASARGTQHGDDAERFAAAPERIPSCMPRQSRSPAKSPTNCALAEAS